MTLTTEFIESVTLAAERLPGSRMIPWPVKGNLGGLVTFASFAEWRDLVLSFRLRLGVPRNMADGFDRAIKLYLLAWLDFDVVTAGELAALAALEHVLRDCYLGELRERHTRRVVAKAALENRDPTAKEAFKPETVKFSVLLNHMVVGDGLTDDQLPCVRRYGGSIVARLQLDSDVRPSLADIRNVRGHGNPFGSGYQSGLLEAVRDLIEYAYRERIGAATSVLSHQTYAPELSSGFNGSGSMPQF